MANYKFAFSNKSKMIIWLEFDTVGCYLKKKICKGQKSIISAPLGKVGKTCTGVYRETSYLGNAKYWCIILYITVFIF